MIAIHAENDVVAQQVEHHQAGVEHLGRLPYETGRS
jgi:hypothetical protein